MTLPEDLSAGVLWTIGHSNHSLASFLDLLRRHAVEVLVDVRSQPYSGYAAHFNREPLQAAVQAAGVKYLFLGDLLGGRAAAQEFYDDEGRVRYDRLAAAPEFQRGIERLLREMATARVAVLCGEEDPTHCHRRRLIGRVVDGRGIAVRHIRGDGRVETEEEVAAEEKLLRTKGQLMLFETEDPGEWRSTQSVLPKKPRKNSSSGSAAQPSAG
jgi:uncharacterized protein (DUF488 family)